MRQGIHWQIEEQLTTDVNNAFIYVVEFYTLVGACPVDASSRVFEIAGTQGRYTIDNTCLIYMGEGALGVEWPQCATPPPSRVKHSEYSEHFNFNHRGGGVGESTPLHIFPIPI